MADTPVNSLEVVTPTSSDTVLGERGGEFKRFTLAPIKQSADNAKASELAAAGSAGAAAASKTGADAARDAALGVAKMYATTAAALADGMLAVNAYFTTPSVAAGEAAILYQKVAGPAATDTGIRIPSAALVPQAMPSESGWMWGVVGAQNRMPLGIKTDGTVVLYKISLPANAIKRSMLDSGSFNVLDVVNSSETGIYWAIVDSAGRVAVKINADGTFVPGKISLPAGCVGPSALAGSIVVPQQILNESGYAFAVVDSNGRIGFGVKIDGTLTGNFPGTLYDNTIVAAKFTPQVRRQVVPYTTDVVEVRPTEWRYTYGQVSVRTAQDGSFWEPFPHAMTPNLRGSNTAGTSLDLRRSNGLRVRGKRFNGAFDPGANPSTTYKGQFNSGTAWPPTGTYAAGDYLAYVDGTSRVIGTDTVKRGDLMVYTGSAWAYQASPSSGSRIERDWWLVSAPGTFDGVTYAANDRIMYMGFQSQSGTGFDRWWKAYTGRGEVYYRGEFDPTGGLPATPVDGDLYQASAVGTTGGFAFAIGDYLLRENGIWTLIPTEPITTVAAGAGISVRCLDASEWEVRRTDKGAGRVGVFLNCQIGTAMRRNADNLVLWSDSMFGVSGVGNSILTKTGRNGTVNSYGGGSSRNVLTMMEYIAATQGDPYRGMVHVMWHGQNNQPSSGTDANMAQIREASLRMSELIGARDARFAFMTVLGVRSHAWNGTRVTVTQHEQQKDKTNALALLQDWYARTFPGQFISTYDALIAAAAGSTTPDPYFPGMTEAQVAGTYGIVPFSFYMGATTLGVPVAQLVYKGAWATAGLPTGGAANDYYIRTANGGTNLIVNVAGTWTEYGSFDMVHLSPAGADALSTAVANFILNANW